jgi:hypothetical protein
VIEEPKVEKKAMVKEPARMRSLLHFAVGNYNVDLCSEHTGSGMHLCPNTLLL